MLDLSGFSITDRCCARRAWSGCGAGGLVGVDFVTLPVARLRRQAVRHPRVFRIAAQRGIDPHRSYGIRAGPRAIIARARLAVSAIATLAQPAHPTRSAPVPSGFCFI